MDEIQTTFFQECEDLLEELESGLVQMEKGDRDSETVNSVFRAVHSIKGGAGAFGMESLVNFAHIFETTLDLIRSNNLDTTSDILTLLLRSADALSDLIAAARDETECNQDFIAAVASELTSLSARSHKAIDKDGGELGLDFVPVPVDLGADLDVHSDALNGDGLSATTFIITFQPEKALYDSANEPLLLLRRLSELGEATITCDASALPDLEAIDPEEAYLRWTIHLRTDKEEEDIREVFEFVDGLCHLEITREADPDVTIGDDPLGEDSAVSDLDKLLGARAPSLADHKGPKGIANPAASSTQGANQPNKKLGAIGAGASEATIRVKLERIDRLVNLVGELVINQAMVTQGAVNAGIGRDEGFEQELDGLKQLTREIQESVMAIRAQPIKSLFQRMSRIVREVQATTDKKVKLATEGEATEIDKTVIERLADPLTHMIRNAIDHGLETPEIRRGAGKSEEGVVSLTAAHRSGRVLITVADDGAGINRPRVFEKAVEKGLIAKDAQLTDSEIDNLIFSPGFSTAKEVSDLSGRGVGMDVVKSAIQSVGGKVSISSRPGAGSVFSISLPLTLAVLDGMVTDIVGQTLVVPLTAIVETLRPSQAQIHKIGVGGMTIAVRGEHIPLIDVGQLMGFRRQPADLESSVVVLIESDDHARVALVLDNIQDQRQVVIKSLEENYGQVAGVAAATILGDGRIALILDVDDVIRRAVAASSDSPPLALTG
ncbi:MAG: chemotaxis protein CheA [Pseudomonadota bacterium]